MSSEVLSVLQHCAIIEPVFPNLKTFELWFFTGELIPFIPLFLSPGTIIATILSIEPSKLPKVMIASILTIFPTLCPNIQEVTLEPLPRDPIITSAISGMLLASNRNTLRSLRVDYPLTEGALEVICKLPNLRELCVVIERETPLPTVVLPSLIDLVVKYDRKGDWLQVFRGATLGKLETIEFRSGSEQIGNFLKEFARVASAQNTLSEFSLYTSCLWNPNYSSLLPFTQLTKLCIESSCDDGCSSTVDDDSIADLARAMPKLKRLALGDVPCGEIHTGVTAKALVALAHHCLGLSTLRIHFRVVSLSDVPQRVCTLRNLEVGGMLLPDEMVLMVAVTLALIFPRIESTHCADMNWRQVTAAISISRKIVNYSSKNTLLHTSN